jgi:L-iditol 2-dehydrogenase
MPTAAMADRKSEQPVIPATMKAAVYRGVNDVRIETVAVPEIGAGEVLIRVDTCGICGTDLKKISTGSHSAPRIFGHEISGTIVKIGNGETGQGGAGQRGAGQRGAGQGVGRDVQTGQDGTGQSVAGFSVGDRVMVFHHIPCGECYYCRHKVFAQCAVYKKVGVTAGFEPSGGGFAEYVRVMDWIVRRGLVKVPDGVSLEQASFVEPVNTCLKAIDELRVEAGETVLVLGQGPIGLVLALLARRARARVVVSDLYPQRLTISHRYGIRETIDASAENMVERIRQLTEGRGADAVILAVGGNRLIAPAIEAARFGGRVMLFAQTVRGEATIDPAAICVDEKTLLGSYSASVELQDETVKLVFSNEIDFAGLISHRFALSQAVEGFELAANPRPESLKIVIQPALG